MNLDKTIDYSLLSRFVSTTNGRPFRGVDALLFRKLPTKKRHGLPRKAERKNVISSSIKIHDFGFYVFLRQRA